MPDSPAMSTLGAQAVAVQRLIVRQGMLLTLVALTIGLPAGFALAKFSTSLRYGVRPHEAVTFTAVPLFPRRRCVSGVLDSLAPRAKAGPSHVPAL